MRRRLRKAYRSLSRGGSVIKWLTVIPAARFLGVFRSTSQIISVWPEGPVLLSRRVVVFMHFDRNGRVSMTVIAYLKDLISNRFCVVFVTNSGMLTALGRAELQKLCVAVFVRRNRGYDFGAWRDVIDTLGLPAADTEELLLINDSMYGPLRPMDEILAKLDYAQADIWGLTESWQERYHLQSFFIAFGVRALRSAAFGKFWGSVKPVPSKAFIVRIYEVGFTQVMMKAGLQCKAIWKYEDLVKPVLTQQVLDDMVRADRFRLARADPIQLTRKLHINRIRNAAARRIAMNPTADLWRQLLLSGFPFIKRELLRKNPTEVEDVGEWVEVVRGTLGLDPEPILEELRAGMKNSAP